MNTAVVSQPTILPRIAVADIPELEFEFDSKEWEQLVERYADLDLYDRWLPRDLTDILTSRTPTTPYVIEGLLGQHSGALIAGKPHAMKSLSMLYGCLEVLSKGTFLGLKANGVKRVTFLETEDPRLIVERRVREFSRGLGIEPTNAPYGFNLLCPGRIDLGDTNTQKQLHGSLKLQRPDMAVFSTLQGMLLEQDWNQQKDMSPIHSFVMQICREVCPVILITHAPQDSKHKRPIGSISQAANYLVVGHVEKRVKPDSTQQIVLNLDSKLGGQEAFTLRLVTEGKEVRGFETTTETKHDRKQDILELHEDDPSLKPAELAERLGVSVQYVRKVLRDAEAA